MKIEKILRENGLRITKERKNIFNFIRKKHIFSALDLQNNFKNIGRASIFRTLNIFVEFGIIRKNLGNYEFSEEKDHHEHKKCSSCGKITKFEINKICDEIIKKAEKDGFEVQSHSINIIGKCRSCR